jgi:hypothetical protein
LAIASPALPAFGRVVREGHLHCPGPGHPPLAVPQAGR